MATWVLWLFLVWVVGFLEGVIPAFSVYIEILYIKSTCISRQLILDAGSIAIICYMDCTACHPRVNTGERHTYQTVLRDEKSQNQNSNLFPIEVHSLVHEKEAKPAAHSPALSPSLCFLSSAFKKRKRGVDFRFSTKI